MLFIMHKCITGTEPHDVKVMINFLSSDRTKKLEIKGSMSKYCDRAFSVAGPKLWNALPLLT